MNEGNFSYAIPADMYGGIESLYQSFAPAPIAPCANPTVHQAVLANSRPTEFLAVRETKGS